MDPHSGPPPPTLVLGAGLSGLMAAWHLHHRGVAVEVWEGSPAVGGWAQTLPWPGPQGEPGFLERGPQSLRVAKDAPLERLLRNLELDLRPSPSGPRGPRWLGRAGARHPSPATLRGLARAPGLIFLQKLRLLGEPFASAASHPDESLHTFFARRLGGAFAREWLPALVAGILAAPPERIGLSALPRLSYLERCGGLLLGSLRSGPERTRLPAGGVGALARALALALERDPDTLHLNRAARALEPLPGGRWRVHGEGLAQEADRVILALPSAAAAALLRPVAPEASELLDAIPRLDLRVWHSRHRPVPGWERGFGLLVHPPEGRGLLGAVSFAADDPRGVPGLMQVRTYLGGAYPIDAALETWPGVAAELRRWLPELPEAVQVREESCPGAFPLLEPGHGTRAARILQILPPGLHWLGADRFGPGIPDLAEGTETWARGAAI